jgi:hypothetical protein
MQILDQKAAWGITSVLAKPLKRLDFDELFA